MLVVGRWSLDVGERFTGCRFVGCGGTLFGRQTWDVINGDFSWECLGFLAFQLAKIAS
jgi:hypothetical protein